MDLTLKKLFSFLIQPSFAVRPMSDDSDDDDDEGATANVPESRTAEQSPSIAEATEKEPVQRFK